MDHQRARLTRRSLLDRPQSLIRRPVVRESATSPAPIDEPDPSSLWPPSLGSWPSPGPRERAGPDEQWLPLSWQLPRGSWEAPEPSAPEPAAPTSLRTRPPAAPPPAPVRPRRSERDSGAPGVVRRWMLVAGLVAVLGLVVTVAARNLPNPLAAGTTATSGPEQAGTARLAKVGTPFTFPNGLTVNIMRLRVVNASADGPGGVRKGQQLLVADVQVTNGGGDPVRLDVLDLQAHIGSDHHLARQVTDPAISPGKATGSLAPGRVGGGAYGFALRDSDDTSKVLIDVQLTGSGQPLVSFEGSV